MKTKKGFFALIAAMLLCASLPVTAFAASAKSVDSSNYIGMEAAKTVALEHAGAASGSVAFTKAKLDYDDGAYEYEIKFTWNGTRYEYEICAVSGKITSFSQKAQKKTGTTTFTDSASDISVGKAKEIALTHAGISASDATFTKAKRSHDDGRVGYEIEFIAGKMEYEFEIDASTGKVLDYNVENHDWL